ncbi:MAG TPA: LacI family DNA-binding transcriptional regulator [Ktedonobacteraceae bacterium]|nr:LacI family DNA-binding transcriptional regulator [Ktedonobacteraceae bacterium]
MKAKITIRDIARLAGVSKSTVSRVLNRSSNVDPETRERVMRVVEEQGFVPSIAATELARGRNRLIGMVVPALSWHLVTDIIQGVARVIENSPYEIILYSSSPEKDFNHIVDRILATNLTVGLLAVIHNQSPQHLIDLYEHGLPIVMINNIALRLDIPSVETDNVGGARMAVQHLISLGHRRIACLLGTPNMPFLDDRYEGYCSALAEAGIDLDPELILRCEVTVAGARACTWKLFAMDQRPTAIFASNDYTAYGVLSTADEIGWHVPTELAVVGFDDISPSAHVRPPLTTVRQPFEEMGQRAAEMLLSIIDEHHIPIKEGSTQSALNGHVPPAKNYDPLPLQVQLPTTLVVRESCGSPRHLSVQSTTLF